MSLTKEQIGQIKDHLIGQLSNFPEEKRDVLKKQILEMTDSEIENFIKENQLTHLGDQCIFCSITSGKIPSVKIAENALNIAILELNPLSKGHTLIIPKDHDGLNEHTKNLAKEISKRIRERLKPNDIRIEQTEIMGHKLIEVVPDYGKELKRTKASNEVLESIKEELTKEVKEILKNDKEEKPKEKKQLPKLKPRFP